MRKTLSLPGAAKLRQEGWLTFADLTEAVLIQDSAGCLRYQNERIVHPFEALDTFLGYLSGALTPETPEEQQARLKEAEL